jgi:KDO2-lipid IV(A) lauroyltransferase
MRLFIWLISRIVGLLPAPLYKLFAAVLSWALRHIVRFRREVIAAQVTKALPDVDYGVLEAGIFRHIGLLVMELLWLPTLSTSKLDELVDLEGREYLDRVLARGKGALVLTAHIGHWEVGLPRLQQYGYDVCVVYKELKHGGGETYRKMIRDDRGIAGISRHGAAKAILKALKRNAIVAFVLDQNMTMDEGVFVDFFDMPACTMSGQAVLAERSGAGVVPICSRRENDDIHHRIIVEPEIPLEPAGESRHQRAVKNTARFTGVLEQMIRNRPAEWIWMHKRWKTRPEDEAAPPITYYN